MLDIAIMLKAIHISEDLSAAIGKAEAVCLKLKGLKLKEAAKKIPESDGETFTYDDIPREHRVPITTNTGADHAGDSEAYQSRGCIPAGHSALMLCDARLRHVAGTQGGAKRYLNIDLLHDQDIDKALALVEAG